MTKCLTTRQSANHARMSLDKYLVNKDLQHLKDAHQILSDAIQAEYDKDKRLTNKATNYS